MSQEHQGNVSIPEWTAELVDAFDAEARQLETLIGVLRQQREGVARDDVGPIQDSVYAIHRVLLTLDEARKRRRTLLEVLSTGEGTSSRDGSCEADRVRLSRERLITTARALETELSLSRQVLESALESTDEELRAVLDGLEESATYAAQDAAHTARAGRLVDRQA